MKQFGSSLKIEKGYLLIVSLFVFLGCATPYQNMGMWGYGAQVTKIEDRIFRVSFTGGDADTIQRINDFALLKSAETVLDNGYSYFSLVSDNQNQKNIGTFNSGSFNSGFYSGYGSTTQYNTVTLNIQCFKEKPQNTQGIVYEAQQVKANLKNQYKL